MSSPPSAVLVDGLTKMYGSVRAVDGVSFEVQAGEVFAILGPNGAGKTTTLEILEGYRNADEGRVEVLGDRPGPRAGHLKARIGVMPQNDGLYPGISSRDALKLFATFYERARTPDELLDLVGLRDSARTQFRRLSGGQKQRLSLALALIGRPELVFLDEPTAGLDPQARRATWDIIANLRSQNVTVLLTTHYLEEAERLADRVAIIDRGRLIALGTPAALVHSDTPTVRLRTSSVPDSEALRGLSSVRKAWTDDGEYVFETEDAAQLLVELTTYFRDRDVSVVELRVGRGTLEDVFLELTGREFKS